MYLVGKGLKCIDFMYISLIYDRRLHFTLSGNYFTVSQTKYYFNAAFHM